MHQGPCVMLTTVVYSQQSSRLVAEIKLRPHRNARATSNMGFLC